LARKKTLSEALSVALELEEANAAAGTYLSIQQMMIRNFVKSQPPTVDHIKERLLAEVKVIQGKIEANREEMSSKQEEMKTQVGSLVSQMDFSLVKTETEAAIKAGQEEMKAAIRSSQEKVEAGMNAWLEETEACLGVMGPV
jgi:flagellar basal body-associated protein FliL